MPGDWPGDQVLMPLLRRRYLVPVSGRCDELDERALNPHGSASGGVGSGQSVRDVGMQRRRTVKHANTKDDA